MRKIAGLFVFYSFLLLGNVNASFRFSKELKVPMHTTIKSIRGGSKNNQQVPIEETPEGPLQTFINTVKESKNHLAAAAAARSVSIFGMFPVGMLYYYVDFRVVLFS